jgi:hypothetical protein
MMQYVPLNSIILKKRSLQFVQTPGGRMMWFDIDALPTGGYVASIRYGHQSDNGDNCKTTRYLHSNSIAATAAHFGQAAIC